MDKDVRDEMAGSELEEAGTAGEGLVMVGRFLDPLEAQMVKGMLESAGIECFLQGMNANAMVPLAFRVRLHVRHSDEREARSLIAAADTESKDG